MRRLFLAASAATALVAGAAQAAPVQIDVCAESPFCTDTRLFAQGGSFTYQNDNDTLLWGQSTGQGRNRLDLVDFGSPPVTGGFGDALLLGYMNYFNRPTTDNPSGIDLRLVFNVEAPSDGLGDLTYTFDGVLTSRANPAADTLDFSSDSPVTRQWTSGGQAYRLAVWIDPAALTVVENNETAARFNIYASVNKVPEPLTLALLGLGCVGLGAVRLRSA